MTGTFSCTLKFIVKDCDPNTGEPDDEGYEDEYVLEDVEVTVADHVQRVMKPNFSASWEEVGPENELEDTYALSTMKTLEGKQWGYMYYRLKILMADRNHIKDYCLPLFLHWLLTHVWESILYEKS